MSLTSVDFAGVEPLVTTVSRPSGIGDVDIFQIVAVRAKNREGVSVFVAALVRVRDLPARPRGMAESDAGFAAISSGDSESNQRFRQLFPRPDQDRQHSRLGELFIARARPPRPASPRVTQRFERVQQAAIVARMQPDRRLVKNDNNAAKRPANLGGEPDAFWPRRRTRQWPPNGSSVR